jgi:hypothetical protein
VTVAMPTCATIEVLEAVFSVQSMPTLCNKEQPPLQDSPESVVREYSS